MSEQEILQAEGNESIAICICTCKRPEGLDRLLRGIRRLSVNNVRPRSVKVVVVDNDEDESARKVCEDIRRCMLFELQYSVEPRRGISYARNRALALAADRDLIVFIDDDEVPCAEWLDQLIEVRQTYGADVVCGPVLPHFSSPVPQWMIAGRFFERPRYATGTRINDPRTSNVLIHKRVIEAAGTFNERFALTGGEDTDFFNRASELGFQVFWSDEAFVTEWLPTSRSNAGWLLRRSFRFGNTFMSTSLQIKPKASLYCINVLRGGWRLLTGSVLALLSVPQGRAKAFARLCHASKGAGILAAAIGIHYCEYKTIHRC